MEMFETACSENLRGSFKQKASSSNGHTIQNRKTEPENEQQGSKIC